MFIDNSLIQNRTGSYKVCVRQMHFEELNEYEDVSMLPTEVPGMLSHGIHNLFSVETIRLWRWINLITLTLFS